MAFVSKKKEKKKKSTDKHTMSISIYFLRHLIIAITMKVGNSIEFTERLLLT